MLVAGGDWTLAHSDRMLDLLDAAPETADDIDGRDISRLDSAGAMMLSRYAVKVGLGLATVEVQPRFQPLTGSVGAICENPPHVRRKGYGIRDMLARMGYAVEDYTREVLALVGFLGLTLKTSAAIALKPARFRLTPTVHHMDQVGLDAVPLVMLLSFMVGAVIAFLGATVLRDFGAEIFVVELVAIAFLREFAVLLTAIRSLDMTFEMYITRLHDTLEVRHFWVGLSKAPMFAMVIALIGCLEGFQTQGTAQSVGERTTSSVVQTISLVILLDAFAALFFMEMDW